MVVYGYTRIISTEGENGRKSETLLFTSLAERNHIMYEDYSDRWDFAEAEGQLTKLITAEWEKKTKEELIKELEANRDPNRAVFARIECLTSQIQYEPFFYVF